MKLIRVSVFFNIYLLRLEITLLLRLEIAFIASVFFNIYSRLEITFFK